MIRDVHPASKFYPHPGTTGKKSTGSRIRNTNYQIRILISLADQYPGLFKDQNQKVLNADETFIDLLPVLNKQY